MGNCVPFNGGGGSPETMTFRQRNARRALIYAKHQDGMSFKAIGAELGLSAQWVRLIYLNHVERLKPKEITK